ncbi:MAG: hypothetical protein FWD82_07880 [Defluviitaleaceae bacterium]|nr:hypothetical protein [Defluviitaleaceae bacterium]
MTDYNKFEQIPAPFDQNIKIAETQTNYAKDDFDFALLLLVLVLLKS